MRALAIPVALTALACSPRPPEQTLPAAAQIPVTPIEEETRARFDSDFRISELELELGYRPVAPTHDEIDDSLEGADLPEGAAELPTTCCGYDTAQVILIGTPPHQQQSVMPFTFGEWELVYWQGARIWAFNETDTPEAGSGDVEIVYSPDRGHSWYSLARVPSPSGDILAPHAFIQSVQFDASGGGSVVLRLEQDDESVHIAPSVRDRLLYWLTQLPGFGWIDAPSIDDEQSALAGDYRYETGDFGRTWSRPKYSPPK